MTGQIVRAETVAHSTASPASVYAVAANSAGYPRWSTIGSFEAVRAGADGPYAVGSRRIYRTFPLKLLEEVVELIPNARVSYILLSGLPFRNYRANIELSPAEGGGTTIRWSNSFEVTWPGMSGAFQRFMQGVFDTMTPQLAREAERLEREGG